MHSIEVDRMAEQLAALLDDLAHGEEVLLLKDHEPVGKIVPLSREEKRTPRFGSARGLIKIEEGFDDPLEDFKEYTE